MVFEWRPTEGVSAVVVETDVVLSKLVSGRLLAFLPLL